MIKKIKSDEKGIFIYTNGTTFRPGDVVGYSHAHDMSSNNLKEGDSVKCSVSSSPLLRITCEDGKVLRWHYES